MEKEFDRSLFRSESSSVVVGESSSVVVLQRVAVENFMESWKHGNMETWNDEKLPPSARKCGMTKSYHPAQGNNFNFGYLILLEIQKLLVQV